MIRRRIIRRGGGDAGRNRLPAQKPPDACRGVPAVEQEGIRPGQETPLHRMRQPPFQGPQILQGAQVVNHRRHRNSRGPNSRQRGEQRGMIEFVRDNQIGKYAPMGGR